MNDQNSKEIKRILLKKLFLSEVHVDVSNNHYHIVAVGKIFFGLNVLDRHKLIYSLISNHILTCKIHAVSIKTFSPEEWFKKNNEG